MTLVAASSLSASEPLLTSAARRALHSAAFRWTVAPAAIAWIALALVSQDESLTELCLGARPTLAGDVMASVSAAASTLDPVMAAIGWALMTTAMMAPLAAPAVSHVETRSFYGRRNRAVALFLVGYGVVWMAIGAVTISTIIVARSVSSGLGVLDFAGPVACLLAALWAVSRRRERALARRHGVVPLRTLGFAADIDVARFGLIHGGRCAAACLPVMAAPLFGGHSLTHMAIIAALLFAERASHQPRPAPIAIALVAIALLQAL